MHTIAEAPGNGLVLVQCTEACTEVFRRRHNGHCSQDGQRQKLMHFLLPVRNLRLWAWSFRFRDASSVPVSQFLLQIIKVSVHQFLLQIIYLLFVIGQSGLGSKG